MIEFGDSIYYIDIKALDKAITIHDGKKEKNVVDKEIKQTLNDKGEVVLSEYFERVTQQTREIDAAKYDLLKTFIEYIIDYDGDSDDALGSDRALSQTSLGYKIVFNTLINEGILKEKEQ